MREDWDQSEEGTELARFGGRSGGSGGVVASSCARAVIDATPGQIRTARTSLRATTMSSPSPRLIIVRHGKYTSSRSHTALSLLSFTGETEWSLNGSVSPYDPHICSLTLMLPNPLPIRRFWCAGVMFVVTSSLRLSHIVLISVVSPHLRSDRTYRYSSHRTGTGADQIKGYFSRRGRKYVEPDNQTLSRSFSSLFPQNLLTRST
jgi:hypothetical protein